MAAIVEHGNIVARYTCCSVPVLVSDSAFAGRTEEELEQIRQEARQIAYRIECNARKKTRETHERGEDAGTIA